MFSDTWNPEKGIVYPKDVIQNTAITVYKSADIKPIGPAP